MRFNSRNWCSIASLTDADTLSYLAQIDDSEITHLLERLLYRPHTLTVRRIGPDELIPAEALVARIEQPYLNQPLVDGQPVDQLSERAASMLAEARTLLGTFVIEVSG